MNKLTLRMDELKVESFDPGVAEAERLGTVKGNQDTFRECCTASCGGTCGANPESNWLKVAATVTNCPDCCY